MIGPSVSVAVVLASFCLAPCWAAPATAPASRPAQDEAVALRVRVAELDTELATYQLREMGVPSRIHLPTEPNSAPLVTVSVARAFPLSRAGARSAGPHLDDTLPLVRRLTAAGADLQMGVSSVGDDYLRKLSGAPGIVAVDLEGTQITDAGVEAVAALPNLQALNLRATPITDRGVKSLAALTRLRSLSLQSAGEPPFPNVTDEGAAALAAMADLEHLNLIGTRVGDAGMRHVAGLTKLRSLSLSSTPVTDVGLRHVAGLARLERLDLWHTLGITDKSVDVMVRLPKLADVNLVHTAVTDAGVARLREALPKIRVEWTRDVSRAWAE